jgi:hypothetical protein
MRVLRATIRDRGTARRGLWPVVFIGLAGATIAAGQPETCDASLISRNDFNLPARIQAVGVTDSTRLGF